MGTWGSEIPASDTFADIYDSFIELFNSGFSSGEIFDKLYLRYHDVVLDEDLANEYYFATAKALWACGIINREHLEKIKAIIDSGSEIEGWLRLGGTEKESQARQAKLIKFYEKISVPKKRPGRPKQPKMINSVFRKGDCLAVKDESGMYFAAVILYDELATEFGFNLVAILNYLSEVPPAEDNFTVGNCLMVPDGKGCREPAMLFCYAGEIKKFKGSINKICSIKIEKDYPFSSRGRFGSWNSITRFRNILETTEARKNGAARMLY